MILYYAPGGGLGHLTRGRAVLEALGLASGAAFLTASPYADDARVTGGARVIRLPGAMTRDRDALRAWLARELAALAPRVIALDAFPAGVLGEWCGLAAPAGAELWHVARLLRWDAYRARMDGPAPRFARTFVLEPLARRHRRFLARHSATMERLVLPSPPRTVGEGGYWLVVHSGPARETAALARHADVLRRAEDPGAPLIVATRAFDDAVAAAAPGARHVDAYPASALFPGAARIVTAGGFNALRETRAYRDRHVAVPFPRALDDQFRRAARRGR